MTLMIQIPEALEAALKARANANGRSADSYVQNLVERDLLVTTGPNGPAFKTGRGSLAKYGPGPSAEKIDANSAEMFQNFAKDV